MTTATVLAGDGRYGDRWHDFAATSTALAGLLAEAGIAAEVRRDLRSALAGLDADLLVVNTSGEPGEADRLRADRDGWADAHAGLVRRV